MHLLPTITAHDAMATSADTAVLPVGSFEQHGDHLPLATDSIVAHVIARELASTYGLLLLPPITIACSHEHEGLLTGSVSISARTLYSIVTDIAQSLERAGIRKLVVISGHGGNYVLSNVVQEANANRRHSMMLFPMPADWTYAAEQAGCELNGHEDMHGGERETSLLLHSVPELVGDGWRDADHLASSRPDLLTVGMAGYTTNGIVGRPSLASAEKGRRLLAGFVEAFRDHLGVLREENAG